MVHSDPPPTLVRVDWAEKFRSGGAATPSEDSPTTEETTADENSEGTAAEENSDSADKKDSEEESLAHFQSDGNDDYDVRRNFQKDAPVSSRPNSERYVTL